MNWRDLLDREDLPVPTFAWEPVVEHDAFYDERRAGTRVDPSRIPAPDEGATVLREVVAELMADRYPEGAHVAELNGGACEEVAYRVVDRLEGVDVMAAPFFDHPRCEDAHIWLRAGAYHFDAEVPDGVRQWEGLPLFRRNAFLRDRRVRGRSRA